MKRSLLILLVTAIIVLVGCSTTTYQNDTHHMKINFPDYMTVYDADDTPDSALLSEHGLTLEGVQSDRDDGCIYLALGTKDGIHRKVAVSVLEDEYTKEIWQLKESDTQTVTEFTDDVIAEFNTAGQQLNDLNGSGCQVVNKGQLTQGDAFCIYLDIAPYGTREYNSIYMATIFNGKWYSVLYNTDAPITTETEQEAHDIFNTFYPTVTLPVPGAKPENQSGLQALLIVIVAAIVIALVVLVVRLLTAKDHSEQNAPYVDQFKDELELMTTKKSKKSKDQ